MLKNGKALLVGPKRSFTRSQLAAISKIIIDFINFHTFSKIFMYSEAWVLENGKALAVGPKESFARSQLAAIT